ncbi:MAG TPA: GNAT family N-acetyltransferase [Gemmatimonadaceae bacterium]|nr:GNAT family N-acetyltransferase [Gemmatimonadaceae bacterium]
MRHVHLVRLDAAVEQSLANDVEYRAALIHDDWARVATVVHRVVGRILTAPPVSVDELHWGGYFAVDHETREVVGSCAFKTAPSGDGAVEIAYFTYPGFEGRGYATQMARRLVELASRSATVRRVIAHTLPETNASTRVLEKVGMTCVGEVMDPDDGRVWRWELPVGVHLD